MESNVDTSMINVSDGQRVPPVVSGVVAGVVAGQNLPPFVLGVGLDGLNVLVGVAQGSSDFLRDPPVFFKDPPVFFRDPLELVVRVVVVWEVFLQLLLPW
ncbi:hypothetical protein LIER_19849 [Lithospermum erythrorhizon]|uniref:Uncharacterized protein n=1 Tax=Lithospermum erythrorhizon TaxID=34254 RepID=A0AAV3QPU2_LITER